MEKSDLAAGRQDLILDFEFWIGRELRAGAGAGGFVFHSKSIIQNSTLHGGRRSEGEEILDFGLGKGCAQPAGNANTMGEMA